MYRPDQIINIGQQLQGEWSSSWTGEVLCTIEGIILTVEIFKLIMWFSSNSEVKQKLCM